MTSARRRDAGLTLAEMLVVLAIIGVMAGVAVLGVGAVDRTVGVEVEARRLAGALSLAADQATLDRRPRVFAWTDDGYAILGGPDAAPRPLASGLQLEVDRGRDNALIAPDGVGPPFEARLESAAERWVVRFDGLQAVAAPAGARP